MNKKEVRKEAMYLIEANIENWDFDVARGVANLAHGIGAITDKQYEDACARIEEARNSYHL